MAQRDLPKNVIGANPPAGVERPRKKLCDEQNPQIFLLPISSDPILSPLNVIHADSPPPYSKVRLVVSSSVLSLDCGTKPSCLVHNHFPGKFLFWPTMASFSHNLGHGRVR